MSEFLYLNKQDVDSLKLSWQELFVICRDALAAKGRGNVENPPKPGVHNKPGAFIHAMPAYNAEIPAIGIKWISGYPENQKMDLPMLSGLIILNNPETGFPICIMNSDWITDARTAAVSAISAEKLARLDSHSIGIIGAGAQARYQIPALEQVLPEIKTVKVYDLYQEAAERYVQEMQSQVRAEIVLVDSPEAAVRDSDVVITAIPKPSEPIVRWEWVKEGALCIPLESSRAWHNEALFGADKFINDDYGQALLYQTQGAFSGGIPEYHAETGEIMAGLKPGRENDQERIMVMNIGLGTIDISVAHHLFYKAKEKQIGTPLIM